MEKRKFSSDCKITNFRINKVTGNIHANLLDSDGSLIISATLDYITEQINNSEIIRSVIVPHRKPTHTASQEPGLSSTLLLFSDKGLMEDQKANFFQKFLNFFTKKSRL